jgi:hypothetical protein
MMVQAGPAEDNNATVNFTVLTVNLPNLMTLRNHHDADEDETSMLPADQERQLILLMLWALVCALHDPRDREHFTVHVLELFEWGIRRSSHFPYDLGLISAATSFNHSLSISLRPPLLLQTNADTGHK